ncbi:MAG: hypothetical protein HWE14_08950 [Flavobacteriia bacterium]|nr:hypothetical protein [Flavobacteriia bacterium]
MKIRLYILLLLTSFAGWAQHADRVDVGVKNYQEHPSGSVSFDLTLECTQGDTVFIGFSDIVFSADWTQFTNPTYTVTSLGNATSRSGNTNLSTGWIRRGIQNNEDVLIYTLDPKFIEYQYQFDDNVIALPKNVVVSLVHIEINGYTGVMDPTLAFVETGEKNENITNMYGFSTRSPKFESEAVDLRFSDFPSLGSPRLDLTVMLEGPFNPATGEMRTDLNSQGFIPLNNPYSGAPWNYSGGDSVTSIPNADVVDWVLVEVRESNNAMNAGGSAVIGTRAAFVLKDGSVVDLDGSSYLEFDNVEFDPSKRQFAVVYHRNHLAIMCADSLDYVDTNPSEPRWVCDMTTGSSQIYGGANGSKHKSGVTMMMAGDGSSDGNIQNTDKLTTWLPFNGTSGYLYADFNLNGQVQNDDAELLWYDNNGKSSQVP